MISMSVTGDVASSSKVPVRFSSANSRIVMMGMKKRPITARFDINGRIIWSFTLIGWLCPCIEAWILKVTNDTTYA
jgi:hypothetical protein